MTVLAIIGMRMFLFCFASIRERVRPDVPTHDDMKNDFKDVWKNDQWVRILLLTLCNVCPGFIRIGDHVLRHLGDGTKHPFRYAFY